MKNLVPGFEPSIYGNGAPQTLLTYAMIEDKHNNDPLNYGFDYATNKLDRDKNTIQGSVMRFTSFEDMMMAYFNNGTKYGPAPLFFLFSVSLQLH